MIYHNFKHPIWHTPVYSNWFLILKLETVSIAEPLQNRQHAGREGGHCTDGGETWHFGPLLHAKFHPHRCNVSPLRGKKTQNLPKLNTGSLRCAQCSQ